MKLRKVISLLLILGISLLSKAQYVTIKDVTPASFILSECGGLDTLEIEVNNCCVPGLGSTYNIDVSDSLPLGIRCVGYIADPCIKTFDNSNIYFPKFTLDTIKFGESCTLKLLIKAECGSSAHSNIRFEHKLTYDYPAGNGKQTLISKNYISNIKSPFLNVNAYGNNSSNDFNNKIIGNLIERKWIIKNNGNKTTIDSFLIKVKLEPGLSLTKFTINGVNQPYLLAGDTMVIKVKDKLRYIFDYPGDTIIFIEHLKITECLDNKIDSKLSFILGCYDKPNCIVTNFNPDVILDIDIPIFTTTPKMIYSNCWGSVPDTFKITFNNTGGVAKDFYFDYTNLAYANQDVFYKANYLLQRQLWYLDTSQIKYKLGTNPLKSIPNFDTILSVPNTYHPEWGIPTNNYAGTIYFDSIPAHDSLTLYFPLNLPCMDSANSWRHSWCTGWAKYFLYQGKYTDKCGNIEYTVNKNNPNGYYGEYLYANATMGNSTNLQTGDTGYFELKFNNLHTNWHADDTTDYFELKTIIPTKKLVWDGNFPRVYHNNGGSTIADSVSYDSSAGCLKAFWKNKWIKQRRFDKFRVNFVTDCSRSGPEGLQGINMQLFRVHSQNCTPVCRMPVSCAYTGSVFIQCDTNCPRGGINPVSYSLERQNFGQPDTTNKGLPLGVNFNGLQRKDRIYVGDTLKSVYVATVDSGSQSPKQFRYGFASSQFPNSGAYLKPFDAEITIYDKSSNTRYTIGNIATTITNNGSNDRTFSWNWSADSLVSGGLPVSYVYSSGDSVLLTCQWVVDKNQGARITQNIVENEFYLSDVANPTNDTSKYYCSKFSGFVENIGYFVTVSTWGVSEYKGCEPKRQDLRFYFSNGPNNYAGDNRMEYEYRKRMILDSVWVEIPDGMIIDSMRWLFRHGKGNGAAYYQYKFGATPKYTIPGTFNASRMVFDAAKLYKSNGGTIVESDEGYIVYLQLFLKPGCPVERGAHEIKYGAVHKKLFADIDGYNTYRESRQQIYYDAPIMEIEYQGTKNKIGGTSIVYWDVKIKNLSNVSNAPNTFFYFQNRSGLITVDSVIDLTWNFELFDFNKIYFTGIIAKGAKSNTFRIYTTQKACDKDSLVMKIGWDCITYPYAGISAVKCTSDTGIATITPAFPKLQTNVLVDAADTVALCNDIEYTVEVKNVSEVNSYDNSFKVYFPFTQGVVLIPDSAYFTFPTEGPNKKDYYINPIYIGGGVYEYRLSDSILDMENRGVTENKDTTYNKYLARIKLRTDCGYISGGNISFSGQGAGVCKDTTISSFDGTFPVVLKKAVNKEQNYLPLLIDSFDICNNQITLNGLMLNLATSSERATDSLDYYAIVLPDSVFYKPNTSSFTKNAPSITEPLVDTVNGFQRLRWQFKNGIPVQDSMLWSFKLNYKPATKTCGSLLFNTQTISEIPDTCGTIACNSFVLSKQINYNIPLKYSDIAVVNQKGTVVHDSSNTPWANQDTLNLSYRLNNNGNSYKKTQKLMVRVYQDNDYSNSINSGDSLVKSDSITFTPNGDFNTVVTQAISSFGGLKCPYLISVTNICDCDEDSTVALVPCNYIALPLDLLYFKANRVSAGKVRLNWAVVDETEGVFYMISRRLENEKIFTHIKTVKGKNELVTETSYSIIDKDAVLNNKRISYKISLLNPERQIIKEAISIVEGGSVYDHKLLVIPNPSVGTFKVLNPFSADRKIDIKVYSANGKMVFQKKFVKSLSNENSLKINIPQIPGVYIIKLMGVNVTKIARHVVVE